jgi:hypothetical protein
MLKAGQVKYAFGQVTFGGNLSDGQVVILVNIEPCYSNRILMGPHSVASYNTQGGAEDLSYLDLHRLQKMLHVNCIWG